MMSCSDYNIYMDITTNIIILPVLVSHNAWEMYFKVRKLLGVLKILLKQAQRENVNGYHLINYASIKKKSLQLNAQKTGMPVQK